MTPSGDVLSSAAPPRGWLHRLGGYCLRFRRSLLLAVTGIVVGGVVAALIPLIVREVVDEVVLGQRAPLAPWLVLLVGAGTLRFLSSLVRRYCACSGPRRASPA